jgi:hypothetical protein
MLERLQRTRDFERDKTLVRLILKLLSCSMIAVNVRKLLEPEVGSVRALLKTLSRAFAGNSETDIAHRYMSAPNLCSLAMGKGSARPLHFEALGMPSIRTSFCKSFFPWLSQQGNIYITVDANCWHGIAAFC